MSREKKQDLIFKALADRRRRKILDLLKKEELTTGDICAYFRALDRCTVMQHLKVLENAGLVSVTADLQSLQMRPPPVCPRS